MTTTPNPSLESVLAVWCSEHMATCDADEVYCAICAAPTAAIAAQEWLDAGAAVPDEVMEAAGLTHEIVVSEHGAARLRGRKYLVCTCGWSATTFGDANVQTLAAAHLHPLD